MEDQRHIGDGVYEQPYNPAKPKTNCYLQDMNAMVGCDFYEGFVAKRAGSFYPFQLDAPSKTTHHWMKHRFIS